MSTTVKQHTQAELDEILVKFEQEARRTGLAETEHNQRLLSEFLRRKYGGFVTSATLADAVASLKPQLQWLALPDAPKPAPAKPTGNVLWNKLVDAGVAPTRHMSVAEQEAGNKRVEDKEKAFLTKAHLIREQAELQEAKLEAENVTVQHPKLGVVWHSKTGEARKAAKAKVAAKIERHNDRCIATGNDNLQVTPPTI
jgi:hypothetical protein